MSATIRDVLREEKDQELITLVFNSYIKKCRALQNAPSKGYGKASEEEKKKKWGETADEAEQLLSRIMEEVN